MPLTRNRVELAATEIVAFSTTLRRGVIAVMVAMRRRWSSIMVRLAVMLVMWM
jgi:hypothetical protein